MTNRQFTEEVFARSKKYSDKRRKKATALCTAAMLLIVCSVGLRMALPGGDAQSASNTVNSQYTSAADISSVNEASDDRTQLLEQNIGTVAEGMTGASATDDGNGEFYDYDGVPGNTDNCSAVCNRLEHFDGTSRIVTAVADPVKAEQITELFKKIEDSGKDFASNDSVNEYAQAEYLWIYGDEQYEIVGSILIISDSQGKKVYEMTVAEAENIKRQLTRMLCERSTDERE